jgi:hypothetical protein
MQEFMGANSMETPVMYSVSPFDIASLESEDLMNVFHETTSYTQNIRIEIVSNREGRWGQEEHPATTIGLTIQKPTVQLVDSLGKGK